MPREAPRSRSARPPTSSCSDDVLPATQASAPCAPDDGQRVPADWADLPLLLTPAEVAELLRTSRAAVYKRVERGAIPGVTRIGRKLLFRREELVAWIDASRWSSPERSWR
ncbi:MAG: hypothetical protein CME06_11975 [Gemmatimonadetes bacterium]|nr:hypothetical protein [Gemmatimonadota bacterium]